MAETTKKSVMFIKKETVEGTPEPIGAATDAISLREGFTMEPSFAVQETDSLKASVGKSQPILGIEEPKASVNQYLSNSGTVAQPPKLGEMIEGALGAVVAAPGTEYATVAGSTAGTPSAAAIVKLASGAVAGGNFQLGTALLIKDPAGYQIRPIQSVSGDDATLGFNLPSAPGTGVLVGRPTLYKPSDVPPSFSLHMFRGNGGAYELMAGSKVASLEISGKAGELLEANFSFEGSSYYFNPIYLTAANNKLDFYDGVSNYNLAIAVGFYKDPHAMASTIKDAMNAVGSADVFDVVYNDADGKFTISSDGVTLSLKFATGLNAAQTIATKLGYTATDKTGAVTYTSQNAQNLAAPYTPSYSDGSPMVVKNMELMLGDFDDYGCSGAQEFSLSITNDQTSIPDFCEESGISSKILSDRTVEFKTKLTLNRYDAQKFMKYRKGDNVRASFNGGVKEGANFVSAKCFNIYLPTTTVSAFSVTDTDGIVTIDITLQAYVNNSGQGECFFTYV